MKKDKIKILHTVMGLLTGALVVLTGVLLILSCLDIYGSGERPFSREVIAEHFQQLSPALWLLLAAVVVGWLFLLLFPGKENRPKPLRDDAQMLASLQAKYAGVETEHDKAIQKEQLVHKWIRCAEASVIAAVFVYPALYLAEPSHFSVSDLNGSVASAAVIVLSAAVFAFVLACIADGLVKRSIRREIALYQAIREIPVKKKEPRTAASDKKLLAIRGIVFLAALCFIVLGIFNLGIDDVLGKAIRICTECIGLG